MNFTLLHHLQVTQDQLTPFDDTTLEKARQILANFQVYSNQKTPPTASSFDGVAPYEQVVLDRHQLQQFYKSLPNTQKQQISEAVEQIKQQTKCQTNTTKPSSTVGCFMSQECQKYPKSTLIQALLAKSSGVQTVVVSAKTPSQTVLGAAYVAGADYFLKLGGVEAIGALAFGFTCSFSQFKVPPCQFIFGFGDKSVTAAKTLLQKSNIKFDLLGGQHQLLIFLENELNFQEFFTLIEQKMNSLTKLFLIGFSREVFEVLKNTVQLRNTLKEQNTELFDEIFSKGLGIVCDSVEESVQFACRFCPERYEVVGEQKFKKEVIERLQKQNFLGGYLNSFKDDSFTSTDG